MERVTGAPPDVDLLDFTDFADISKVLSSFRGVPGVLSDAAIADMATQLELLSPVRNRVCHSRPLEPDDFAKLYDFATALMAEANASRWPSLVRALSQLRSNPDFVLDLEIPAFWSDERVLVLNNLPLAEFDDTGFLGARGSARGFAAACKRCPIP